MDGMMTGNTVDFKSFLRLLLFSLIFLAVHVKSTSVDITEFFRQPVLNSLGGVYIGNTGLLVMFVPLVRCWQPLGLPSISSNSMQKIICLLLKQKQRFMQIFLNKTFGSGSPLQYALNKS